MSLVNEIQGLFSTDRKPKIFELGFSVLRPVTVEVTLADPMRPNTAYTCREVEYKSPDPNEVWRMKLPRSSEFIVLSMKINRNEPIERYIKMKGLSIHQYNVPKPHFGDHAQKFFEFISSFCEQMGYLPTGRTYTSNDKYEFEVEYLEAIPGIDGGVNPTPARIHTTQKYIQESAVLMRPKPVGRRIGINAHEYSHEWKNSNPNSEFQADLNGAWFFDQLGWNDWDYIDSFTKTFEQASEMVDLRNPAIMQNYIINQQREQAIKRRYARKTFLSR